MLDHAKKSELQSVEIGTGGNPGDAHCKLENVILSKCSLVWFMEC